MPARPASAIVCSLGLATTALTLTACRTAAPRPPDPLRDLRGLLALIEQQHVEPIDGARLAVAARDGMLTALDPYSSYVDAVTYTELKAALAGHFGGIGMRIDPEPGGSRYIVRAPMAGSPALAAGIRAGDVVAAIDGRQTAGQPMDAVLGSLRGTAGTAVEVALERAGESLRLRVTRAVIDTVSVRGTGRTAADEWDYRVASAADIAYLRIAYFATTTPDEVGRALTAIDATRPRALVLDLRHNRGGSLQAAIGVADHFLDRGRIVSVRSRGGIEHRDATPGTATSLPVAVLVDEATISAAEILAASLQDNGRAIVVGVRTFGKGTVQQLFHAVPGGGAYRLTTAHYLRPSGRPIERHLKGADAAAGGVAPDAGLEVAPAVADAQALIAALETADENASLVGLGRIGDGARSAASPDSALAAACAALSSGRPPAGSRR